MLVDDKQRAWHVSFFYCGLHIIRSLGIPKKNRLQDLGIPSLQAQVFGSPGKYIPGEVISCNEWGKRLRHLVMCLVEETISSLAMGRVVKRLSSVELTWKLSATVVPLTGRCDCYQNNSVRSSKGSPLDGLHEADTLPDVPDMNFRCRF